MDKLVRATAQNGDVRIIAAITTDMVQEGISVHNCSPTAAATLGRMLTAGSLMGALLKNERVRAKVLCQDISILNLKKQYDLITCALDSTNIILSKLSLCVNTFLYFVVGTYIIYKILYIMSTQ